MHQPHWRHGARNRAGLRSDPRELELLDAVDSILSSIDATD